MSVFMEMNQYVVPNGKKFFQDETGGSLKPSSENQRLKQPQFGWCARVCLDIAIAYALQKTIRNLNVVNPNLTERVGLQVRKNFKQHINILKGGFVNHIYGIPTQWKNSGLFDFNEKDINDYIVNVMRANNLQRRTDGSERLAPVFTEHRKGTVPSKLSKLVDFLEEETPTSLGIKYKGLRVCLLQFVRINGTSRHECIVCGTNADEREKNPELPQMINVYNP